MRFPTSIVLVLVCIAPSFAATIDGKSAEGTSSPWVQWGGGGGPLPGFKGTGLNLHRLVHGTVRVAPDGGPITNCRVALVVDGKEEAVASCGPQYKLSVRAAVARQQVARRRQVGTRALVLQREHHALVVRLEAERPPYLPRGGWGHSHAPRESRNACLF